MNCPITGCPIKKVVLSTLVAFVVIFAFDYVFHSIYMMPDYLATAQLWRSPEEMKDYFQFITIAQFMRAFGYAGLFALLCKCTGGCNYALGIRFGLITGILIGACSIASHAYMPVPLHIPLKWLGGEIVQAVLVGIALTMFNRHKSGCCSVNSGSKEQG